jgi:long-chain acyl-CoA synthetase
MNGYGLGDLTAEQARNRPAETAVVDGAVRLTFAEVEDRTNRLARVLLAAGCGEGARVMWLGQNSFRLFEVLIACAKVGAGVCPVNWRQSPLDIAADVADIDPQVVFWEGDGTRTGSPQMWPAHADRVWIKHDDDGQDGYEARLRGASADPCEHRYDPDRVVVFLYCASPNGRPNAAMLSQTNLLTQSLVLSKVMELWADCVYLACGPMFHIGTVKDLVPVFGAGGRLVFTAAADPKELCELIDRERVTRANIFGPTAEKMVELNTGGVYDLSSLQSSLPTTGWAAMVRADACPWALRGTGYGQAEVTGIAC